MYVLLQVAAWRVAWLTPLYIVAGMAGGLIPDLVKLKLLLLATVVESLFGVPFSWGGFTTLWGSLLTAGILVLLVDATERRRVFSLLVLGLLVHKFLDALIVTLGPVQGTLLQPLRLWDAPDIDLSTYLWPPVVATAIALAVYLISRSAAPAT